MTSPSRTDVEAELQELLRERSFQADDVATRFGASQRLIVYGSLVPGGSNHSMLAGLAGEWTQGWITGTLVHAGWGDALGYPALRWDPRGERVSAHLLDSSELPSAWPRLDEFEGAEYRRVLIPFFVNEHDWVIGQVYADRVG